MASYFSYIKKRFKLKNYITYFFISFFVILFMVFSSTNGLKTSSYILINNINYTIIAALSLSLVIGFLGELSLGHAGFMAIGAYTGALLQTKLFPTLTKTNPLLAIIIAMIVGGLLASVFGFIIGLPALRLKGDYLAIVTLAFGEIIKVLIENTKQLGGNSGLISSRYQPKNLIVVGIVMVLITTIVIQNFIKSKHGRAVMAIRDNEIAAKAMGVNVTYYKLLVFVISAFFAGVAGVLFAATQSRIQASSFGYNNSIDILVIVVLGGMGNINGTILSAVLITFLDSKLTNILTGDLADVKKMIYALILVLIVVYNNAPKLKTFREKHSFKKWLYGVKNKILSKLTKKPINEASDEREFSADWSKVPTKIEMNEILSTKFTNKENYIDEGGKKDG